MLVFAGRSATFTVSYESGEEKRKKKRIQPYNAQHTTFHFEIQGGNRANRFLTEFAISQHSFHGL